MTDKKITTFLEFIGEDKNPEETLVAFIKKDKSKFSDWYCGVTDCVSRRLGEHESDRGITIKLSTFVKCSSKNRAIILEKKMQVRLCRGEAPGPGGVNEKSKYVYIFKLK